ARRAEPHGQPRHGRGVILESVRRRSVLVDDPHARCARCPRRGASLRWDGPVGDWSFEVRIMKHRALHVLAVVTIVSAALFVSGCATPYPGPYYYGAPVPAQSVEFGVVENVRPVTFQGPDTGIGTLGGAALGGWAGSGIGSGGGNAAAIV